MRALVFVLCACSSKSPEPAHRCDETITAATQRIASESNRVGLDAGASERMRLTMVASCEAEHWSAEALGCIATARLEVDLLACTEKLTHEQYVRLSNKLRILASDAPRDAGPAAIADAEIAAPIDGAALPADAARAPVDARVRARDAGVVFPDAGTDCTSQIKDTRDRNCIKQFCARHQDDPRCSAE
jgi:hypothetical protein